MCKKIFKDKDGKIKILIDRKIPKFDKAITLKSNSMLSVRFDLYNEWFFEKNDKLNHNIYQITKSSTKEVWWICSECGSPYDMQVQFRTRGSNCPYCRGLRVNETNSLSSLRPDIAKQWDFKKNGDLTPDKVSCKNGTSVYWICDICGSSHKTQICSKTAHPKCKFCSGKDVNHTNSLANLNPTLASEWHPTKNGELTPDDVTCGSQKKVWWLGKCGHEWESSIANKAYGYGCPYCANQKILIGFNDMWTTNTELAKMLANPEDGYRYMQNSHKKVDWKCSNCREIVKSKKIADICTNGIKCEICSDNFSLGERIVYFLLKSKNIEFYYDQSLSFAKNKRYDFYIPSLNMIIEVHGRHHYEQSRRKRARTLAEEQENDRIKEQLAMANGIEHYIVIDARHSDFDFIKNNIMNSELIDALKLNVDVFKNVDFNIVKSFVVECWKLWNSGVKSTKEISSILSLSISTVIKYLKIGTSINKCDYNVVQFYPNIKRPVVKLTMNNRLIEQYESVSEAQKRNNFKSSTGISKTCDMIQEYHAGFRWMYLKDYEKLQKQQNNNI